MTENKAEIVKALLPVLQMTRQFEDLVSLEYEAEMGNMGLPFRETVTATFLTGFTKQANVSLDSGVSMLVDIIRQLR